MEYCNGGDLYQLMAQIRKRVFTEAEVQKILKKILEGMKALQQQNVAHRDLKPENFVLNFTEMPSNLTEQAKREYQRNFNFLKNDNWELKLIDFGFAKSILEDETTETMLGTLVYVSPEVVNK